MRKNFSFSGSMTCLLLWGASAAAQPVLTAENYTPQVGDTYGMLLAGYQAPGAGGADLIWDFNGLNGGQDTVVTYIHPDSTGLASTFPDATVVLEVPTNTGFFNGTSAGYFCHGVKGLTLNGVATVPYTDPQQWMEFPFNYQDSFTDDFSGTYTLLNINFTRTGTITITADAYGTLVLPDTTLHGLLRVKAEESYTDTYSSGSNSYSSTNYAWYYPGVHAPVLAIGQQYINGSLIADYSTYMKKESIVPTAIKEPKLDVALSLFPNPSAGAFHLKIGQLLKDARVEVYSADGRLVLEQPIEDGRNAFSLASNPAGLYLVKLISDEGVRTIRLVKN